MSAFFGWIQGSTVLLLTIPSLLVALYNLLRRADGPDSRPPQVPFWIPWLGSAFALRKDPDAFFATARNSYGPVFRVKALGTEMTYITSPELIRTIYRGSETFLFTAIRQEMHEQIFQLSKEVSYSEELTASFFPAHHRALVPRNIRGLLCSYAGHSQNELDLRIIELGGQSQRTSLAEFITPTAYCTIAKALFGASYPAEHTMPEFTGFDSVFHMIIAGIPLWMMPTARRSWDELIAMCSTYLQDLRQRRGGSTDYMDVLLNEGDKNGWSDQVLANILTTSLWTVEANSSLAIYWTIALLLQHPTAMQSVLAELDAAREKWAASHTGIPPSPTNFYEFMEGSSGQFTILTSCIHESIRLRSSTFSIRQVGVATEFSGYSFKVGDRLVCNTRAVHMDERVYDRPTEFIFDRFTETGRKRSVQNGKSGSPPFFPFGGGESMCEGRYFAMGAMKIFVATLLTNYTLEVDPSSCGTFPQPQMERVGAGMIDRKGDVDVLIKRRSL